MTYHAADKTESDMPPVAAPARNWRSRATVTVEQAASILGIGRSSAYALAGTGGLPTLRLGRRYVVPVASLRQMLGESDPRHATSPLATDSAQEVGDVAAHNAE